MSFRSYFPCALTAFGPAGEAPHGGIVFCYQSRFHPIGVGAVDSEGRVWLYCRDYSTDVVSPLPAWVHQTGETFAMEKA